MKEIKGVLCLLVTPLTEKYQLNEDALRREIDWVIENGGDGIIPMGSVGEFTHLASEERKKILEICIDQVGTKTLTVAGTSADTTHQAIEYTKYAEELGYDGAIIIPPYYWRATEEEVQSHYRMISEATKRIQLAIYNNPKLSKFEMSTKFIRKLAEIDRVTALKDSEEDITRTLFLSDKLAVLRTPVWFLYGLLTGGAGGTISPFAIPSCAKIYKWFREGKLADALELQKKVSLTKPFTIMEGEAGVGWLGK